MKVLVRCGVFRPAMRSRSLGRRRRLRRVGFWSIPCTWRWGRAGPARSARVKWPSSGSTAAPRPAARSAPPTWRTHTSTARRPAGPPSSSASRPRTSRAMDRPRRSAGSKVEPLPAAHLRLPVPSPPEHLWSLGFNRSYQTAGLCCQTRRQRWGWPRRSWQVNSLVPTGVIWIIWIRKENLVWKKCVFRLFLIQVYLSTFFSSFLWSFSFSFLPVFLPSFKLMESCCLLTLQLQLRRFWTSYREKEIPSGSWTEHF